MIQLNSPKILPPRTVQCHYSEQLDDLVRSADYGFWRLAAAFFVRYTPSQKKGYFRHSPLEPAPILVEWHVGRPSNVFTFPSKHALAICKSLPSKEKLGLTAPIKFTNSMWGPPTLHLKKENALTLTYQCYWSRNVDWGGTCSQLWFLCWGLVAETCSIIYSPPHFGGWTSPRIHEPPH